MCCHLEDDTHLPHIVPLYLVAQKYDISKTHCAKWYLLTLSIPNLSIRTLSIPIWSMLTEVGIDKVGIDEIETDGVVKHTVPSRNVANMRA